MEIVDIVGISNTTSTVTWDPPIQTNGIIAGYELMCFIYERTPDIMNVSLASDVKSYNITDLCKLCNLLCIAVLVNAIYYAW